MQSEPVVNILLVDDHPENLLSLEAILEPLGANLVRATSGEAALQCLLEQDFAVILLDVQMPGMDGFETASLIRSRRRSRQTPIIFVTAFSSSSQLMFKGYSLGAVDYLHKPIDPAILLSKVTVFVELFQKTLAIQQQSQALERQAEQLAAMNAQLQQREAQFRLVSTCSPVGIFVTDTDGHLTYTNPRFQSICGFNDAAVKAEWLTAIYPDDEPRILAAWSTYLKAGCAFSEEFRLWIDTAVRWVQVQCRPMFSDTNELMGHVGTIEDISDRKTAEAIQAQVVREQIARQEAEAANRMKDEFLAVLSHELRTPLNSMMGWAKLLCNRKLDEATTLRALQTIERNANAQSQLIEDILDVSRIIRGKLSLNCSSVQLLSVIETAIEAVRPQAEAKELQLTLHANSKELVVWGDPVRLQQIVWNLLTNAVKFTPTGGQIDVELSQQQETAQIRVCDTGIGIDSAFLPHVFDRFRQADSTTTRAYNGLGLGLAIVRHLVELHHGTIYAESAGNNQGATFTVRLPIKL